MPSSIPGEARPDGLPVGRALAIPDGPFHRDLSVACRLIDRVHGDGALPTIPATLVPELGRRGIFLYDDARGVPIAIRVNADLSGRIFHALHEVGHFLDFSGIGRPGVWRLAIEPLLPIEEFWARSYAQYVTTATGDPGATTTLDALVRRPSGGLHVPVQWEENDFSRIAEAIDRLFRRLRWRTANVF